MLRGGDFKAFGKVLGFCGVLQVEGSRAAWTSEDRVDCLLGARGVVL